MWIYQETLEKSSEEPMTEKGREAASASHTAEAIHTMPQEKAEPFPEEPIIETAPARQSEPKLKRAQKGQTRRNHADVLLLAGAYCFGTLLAGILQAMCTEREQAVLAAYLQSWLQFFAPQNTAGGWQSFGVQYLSAWSLFTAMLLAGFSVCGTVLAPLLLIFYGIGSGIVTLQLTMQQPFMQALLRLPCQLPAAVLTMLLCFFGRHAMRTGAQLHRLVFRGGAGGGKAPSAVPLLGHYLLCCVLLIPMCAAAMGLSRLFCGF